MFHYYRITLSIFPTIISDVTTVSIKKSLILYLLMPFVLPT